MENGKQGAFASVAISGNNGYQQEGLTKREYFAGLAMQGLCVNKITSEIKQGECVDIAELSLLIADELLKQLEQ